MYSINKLINGAPARGSIFQHEHDDFTAPDLYGSFNYAGDLLYSAVSGLLMSISLHCDLDSISLIYFGGIYFLCFLDLNGFFRVHILSLSNISQVSILETVGC